MKRTFWVICFVLLNSFVFGQSEEQLTVNRVLIAFADNKGNHCELCDKALGNYPNNQELILFKSEFCKGMVYPEPKVKPKVDPKVDPKIEPKTEPKTEPKPTISDKKPESIDVNLRETSQNKFAWSSKLSEKGASVKLKISSQGISSFTVDVSNQSSYTFSTGNAKWDGVPCTVELIVVSQNGITISGKTKIEALCACKP